MRRRVLLAVRGAVDSCPIPQMWTHSRVALSLNDLGSGARLLRNLPGYLRHPLSVEEARTVLRRRLEEDRPTTRSWRRRAAMAEVGCGSG
jgi:hypothetical protein